MSKIDWADVLDWDEEKLDQIRAAAYAYLKQGIYDTALTFFNALALLTPQSAYDLQTIGALYLQLGNGEKALTHLDKALKLDPNHLGAQLNRAKALFMLGKNTEGTLQAMSVEKGDNPSLANQASALILTHKE